LSVALEPDADDPPGDEAHEHGSSLSSHCSDLSLPEQYVEHARSVNLWIYVDSMPTAREPFIAPSIFVAENHSS
jgi:hypothetical protein